MASFSRNNLDLSSSPYLQQHKENPIHWQEWNEEVLQYAKDQNKLIFVSIGYATCHWCHVMAREAFIDEASAAFLNEHFVSIKVDREQRPDLDDYFMSFAHKTIGHGGWPLNSILSPDAKPFFVGTYFPLKSKQGIPGFLQMLKQVKSWYADQGESITPFVLKNEDGETVEEQKLFSLLTRSFDEQHGGFGTQTKFPPHSTLIFLLAEYEAHKDAHLIPLITRTLNEMMNNGLHDHLQGGFYRYTVDRQWQIPHFEKMLYDQAMHLWTYSWAYHLFGIEEYKDIVKKLLTCLKDTFHNGEGLYYSALDADTNHEEGLTYIWEYKEFQSLLSEEELDLFWDAYIVSKKGNFEGKNHLIKSLNELKQENSRELLQKIEEKLLAYRSKREQPFTDEKILTSWNALLGVGLIQAQRYCELEEAGVMAKTILDQLIEKHRQDRKLLHSSLQGKVQPEHFLEDYASLLLLCSYLYESDPDEEGKNAMCELKEQMNKFFQDGQWLSNPSISDFTTIPATSYDMPIPSPVSLAEFALYRVELLIGEYDGEAASYQFPTQYDFINFVNVLKKGNLHELHIVEELPWKELPLLAIQKREDEWQDCYKYQCRRFENKKDLLESLKK